MLSKCRDAITGNAKAPQQDDSAATKVSAFSLYVEEKLSQLDKRHRRVAEKRISDVLFEIEMSADLPADGEVNHQQLNLDHFVTMPQQIQQSCFNIQGQSCMDCKYILEYL